MEKAACGRLFCCMIKGMVTHSDDFALSSAFFAFHFAATSAKGRLSWRS
jgi:hypothetical protein